MVDTKKKVEEKVKKEDEGKVEKTKKKEKKQERNKAPTFITLKSFEKKYGTRNFIEIALKRTERDEDNVFISISKGFFDREGNKRYKRSLGFAVSEEMKNFVIKAMKEL